MNITYIAVATLLFIILILSSKNRRTNSDAYLKEDNHRYDTNIRTNSDAYLKEDNHRYDTNIRTNTDVYIEQDKSWYDKMN